MPTMYDNDNNERFWGNAGAGVLPFCTSTKRFLVPKRSADVNEPLTWGVWGGKIEAGEDPETAVKREFEEEAGYLVPMHCKMVYLFNKNSFKYYNYLGTVKKEFDPIIDWETDSYKWMTYEELLALPRKHFGLIELLKNAKSEFENLLNENALADYINKLLIMESKHVGNIDTVKLAKFILSQMKKGTQFDDENYDDFWDHDEYDDPARLAQYLEEMLDKFEKEFDMNNIIISRAITVESVEQYLSKPNKRLGIYWSSLSSTQPVHGDSYHEYGITFETSVKSNMVNWAETLIANIANPSEMEIRLFKNTPIRLTDISIKKLNNRQFKNIIPIDENIKKKFLQKEYLA